jgi:hypothetical protein
MNSDFIPFGKIQEIAKEVTKNYNPKELPTLEEISWAFPVEGNAKVYYNRLGYMKRIPNTQEGNAMNQLMNYKNLDNVLKYLTEGKYAHGMLPHHTVPVGDADDGAYMIYPYLMHKEILKGEKQGQIAKGFFWENLPEELLKLVLKTDGTGRGMIVDEWGNKIERKGTNSYIEENLTRQYLQNLRETSEQGRKYLHDLLSQKGKAKDYPQLVVDSKPELWIPETQFQWAFYTKNKENYDDNGARLYCGKVLSNLGDKLEVESENYKEELTIENLKRFGEHGMLWKLVPAGE